MSRTLRRRSAFTLIELLVVIAIIAILAAILFPVFSQAREKARQSQCLNNYRNISMAVLQYSQDYDELYPDDPYDPAFWINTTFPYLRNAQIHECPSSPPFDIGARDYLMQFPMQGKPEYHFAYTINVCLGNLSQAAIVSPVRVMMLIEPWSISVMWSTCNQPIITNATQGGYPFNPSVTRMARWTRLGAWQRRDYRCPHLSGENYAYTDGHVKWIKAGSTTSFWAVEPGNVDPNYPNGAAWGWIGPNGNGIFYWLHPMLP